MRIPATLAEFNRRYPKIQFSLSTGPSGTMLEGVLGGKLNAAFIDGPINHTAIDGIPVEAAHENGLLSPLREVT